MLLQNAIMKTSAASLLRRGTVASSKALAILVLGLGGSSAVAAEPPPAGYEACVHGDWPTIDDAETRASSCSKALQSMKLGPDEVALARLTRGAARYALGESVIADDDYGEALKHYDGEIDPRNPDALTLYRRGASFEGLGQTDKALQDFTQAIKLDSNRAFAYLDRGVLLATRTRDFERAIDDFNRALELEPRNVAAFIARGSAYNQLGRSGLAIADLDRAIALSPQNSEAYYHRGTAHYGLGQTGLSLQDYDSALRINPQNVAVLVDRAGIYAAQSRYDLAITDLDAAIAIKPDSASAFYNRGYAHFAKREYEQAIADYGQAIALDPKMANAFNNRCLVRTILGKDLVRALADCDTALKLAPLSLNVRATRGFVFLKLGDPQLAVHEYDAVLELAPDRPVALYGRGLSLIAAGRTAEGRRDKAAALVVDPNVGESFSQFGLD